MIAAIRLWFAALTQREQWLVGVAGALTALAVSIFGILLPILSAVDQAMIDHDDAVQRRGRIVATVDAAQIMETGQPSAATADIDLLITQNAAEKGFDLVKSANSAPGQISFRIDQARAPALLAWLTDLEGQNVVVRSVALRPGANSTVSVDAQLQMRAP
ncbi:type II secretion system protein GspM [Sphingorhabdus sp. EL138]|uniref:type II secretion system protein GspM n=1 Tax=Sphingorhabdus sp. EL138 TaxID=2073156 RepID=UPI0025CC28BE|nr:type II secretion system protein GspM [Sphingorhabdus sp. EL138]